MSFFTNKLDARLDLDLRCNYHCVYCCHKADNSDKSLAFPLDKLDSALKILADSCWSVHISCGGEPLLHPQLKEALGLVSKHLTKCDVTLITNGSLLTEEIADILIKSTINKIYISVDTIDPLLYPQLCGCHTSMYDKVRANIESLARKCKEQGGPAIIITAIAMRQTLDKLMDLAEWIVKTGIPVFKVQWLSSVYMPELEKDIVPLDKNTFEVIDRLQKYLSANQVYFEYPYTTNKQKILSVLRGLPYTRRKADYLLSFFRKFRAIKFSKHCRMTGESIFIKSSGVLSICPCDALPLPNLYALGDKSLAQVIAEGIKKINSQSPEICKNCYYKSVMN